MDSNQPLRQVIAELTGHQVISVEDSKLGIEKTSKIFNRVVRRASELMRENPIHSSSPNKVGNKIEAYIQQAINEDHTLALRKMPLPAGYPDIKAMVKSTNEIIYIECKTYNQDQKSSTQRSFFLSPGPAIRRKITSDGMHIYIGFEMEKEKQNIYIPRKCFIGDSANLSVKLKQEWNSNNHELYNGNHKILDLEL